MKKRIRYIIAILTTLLLATSLWACSGKKSAADNTDFPAAANETGISITAAYNQAADLGFTGTLEEFIALISGKDGLNGADGINGTNGKDGINGQDGKDGKDGKDGINGQDGKDGKDGVNGQDGQDGKDGRGIKGVWVNANGELIVTFTDGTYVNAGSVVVRCRHSYGIWQTGVAATCTSIGYDYRTCSQCGNKDYRFNQQLGHYYAGAVTVIKATCTEVGLSVLTCLRCGDTQSRVDSALGHNYSRLDDNCLRCGINRMDVDYVFTLIDDGTAYEIKCKNKKLEGEVVIPAEYHGLPVTKIGSGGFVMMQGMTKVVIPEGIVEIGQVAFARCAALETISISKTVTAIKKNAFNRVDFHTVQIDSDNPVYSSTGNCIIEKATKTLLFGGSSSVIPDDGSVEHIEQCAFEKAALSEIVIPNGIQTIGSHAFYDCGTVDRLSVSASVMRINASAFQYTRVSGQLTVDAANVNYKSANNCLIEIESKTLIKGCSDSVIPSDGSVEIIGAYAFYNCGEMMEIVVPEGVKMIEGSAFNDCYKLEKIVLPDSLQVIGDYAFSFTAYYNNKDNWTDGVLYIGKFLIAAGSVEGTYTIKDGTIAIAEKAFYGCNKLTNLIISDSVKWIGPWAFEYCRNLKSVTIGVGVQIIGAFAFYDCTSLEEAVFVDSDGWRRQTQVTEPEALELSDPAAAAELLKACVHRVGNTGYGYVWYKGCANAD